MRRNMATLCVRPRAGILRFPADGMPGVHAKPALRAVTESDLGCDIVLACFVDPQQSHYAGVAVFSKQWAKRDRRERGSSILGWGDYLRYLLRYF